MNMNINWYPGHMKKTIEDIEKKLKMVDMVIELLDSRIPVSSKNPLLNKILKTKKRLVILNKADLSDDKENSKWVNYFKDKYTNAILYNSLENKGVNKIIAASEELLSEEIERNKSKGIENINIRTMVVGIPNVGKSTFINNVSGRKSTKTGNRPGITKTNQWIKIHPKMDLLDTPGILWPKFESDDTALNLAFIGSIKDEILDTETLSLKLIERLKLIDKNILELRYKFATDGMSPLEIMEEIGRKRGALLKGNQIDYTKVANLLLDEFRKGLMGRITLERVEDII